MALKNPLGKIKDVAVGSMKSPKTAVGSAVGLAKGVTGKAAGAVTSLAGRQKGDESSAPAAASRTEPVNVTEELGLDPAPVEKPKPAKKTAGEKPMTEIDAAADPSKVDVTPADVAEVVSKDAPSVEKPAGE